MGESIGENGSGSLTKKNHKESTLFLQEHRDDLAQLMHKGTDWRLVHLLDGRIMVQVLPNFSI